LKPNGIDLTHRLRNLGNNWAQITPLFDYLPEIRKIIYTTNAIESVNMSLPKVTKSRGSFPNDESVMKLFYLALNNISKKWTMPLRDWKRLLFSLRRGCLSSDYRYLHKIRYILYKLSLL
jgi:transposase-like protein